MTSTSDSTKGATDRRRPQAWRILALGITGSLANLAWPVFLLPRFASIIHDMLQPAQITGAVRAILGGTWAFVALAVLWPVLALWIMKCARVDGRRLQWYLAALAVAIFVQFCIPAVILLSSLTEIIRHMAGHG
jgi:hypothetical protein